MVRSIQAVTTRALAFFAVVVLVTALAVARNGAAARETAPDATAAGAVTPAAPAPPPTSPAPPPTTATSTPLPRHPQPAGTRVVVLGDSITFLTAPTLQARFDGRGFRTDVISGLPGIRSDQRVVEGADLVRPHDPQILVLELGTNDVGQLLHDVHNASTEQIDALAASVVTNEQALAAGAGPHVACVVVVNVSGNTLSPKANDTARAENRAMAGWAAADPRIRIADWDRVVTGAIAAGEPDGPVTTDAVHPSPLGAVLLTDLVEQTIDTCPAA